MNAVRSASRVARSVANVQVRGMAAPAPGAKKVSRDKYMRGVVCLFSYIVSVRNS